MRRIVYAAVVALALAAAAHPGLAQAQAGGSGGTGTITPGVGIGSIKVGMHYSQVEKILQRDPARKDDQILVGQRPEYIFYVGAIEVKYWHDGKAELVSAGKGNTAMADGVRVGDTVAKMQGAFGAAYEAHALPVAKGRPQQVFYAYTSKGIGFQAEGDRIILISVFKPATK